MNLYDKFQGTKWVAIAIYTLLALFFTAQLIIISALGTSFTKRKNSADSQKQSSLAPKQFRASSVSAQLNSKAEAIKPKSGDDGETVTKPAAKKQRFPLLTNPTSWPPVENRLYPDMELYNQDGKLTRLSDFSGQVIVVQPVAMSCPLSQAYSGANQREKQAFGLCFPTLATKSFGELLEESTGIRAEKFGLVYVQLLLFNMQNQPASIEDGKRWARHFDLRTSNNQYVLIATSKMSEKSRALIPGFHLIDRSFHLRSDSAGLIPKRSLGDHFFPTLKSLFPQSI